MNFLASLLAGIFGKIAEAFLGWFAPYMQGRNAERAKELEKSSQQSTAIADAQAAARDVTVNDDWLHRGSHPDQATDLHGPGDAPGPR